jgi:hypothetical protein
MERNISLWVKSISWITYIRNEYLHPNDYYKYFAANLSIFKLPNGRFKLCVSDFFRTTGE